MLAVRLVMVACLAALSISLTPAQPAQTNTGCASAEIPGKVCSCCM